MSAPSATRSRGRPIDRPAQKAADATYGGPIGEAVSGTRYVGYHLATDTTTPGGAAVRMDRAGLLRNLYVRSTTPAAIAFTVAVCSGTTSPPICGGTRPQCTVAAGATTCSDTASAVTVAQGDYVELQIGAQGTAIGNVGFSVELSDP